MVGYSDLVAELIEIKSSGFVKTHRAGNTGIGKTLEDLLGIYENNVPGPDGDMVELKSARKEAKSMPNIEFKFPKTDLDKWTLDNSRRVVLNGKTINVSAVELQIAYKLLLGSEKDIEDARYLHHIFNQHLDQKMLKFFLEKLDKVDDFNRYLR